MRFRSAAFAGAFGPLQPVTIAKSAGALTLADGAFPAIAAEKNLAIRYKAMVSASEAVTNINAATIVFTIAAVSEKEAA